MSNWIRLRLHLIHRTSSKIYSNSSLAYIFLDLGMSGVWRLLGYSSPLQIFLIKKYAVLKSDEGSIAGAFLFRLSTLY